MAILSEFVTDRGVLQVDAVVSFKESAKNTLSKYTIETKEQITEHMSSENPRIIVQGVISDATPSTLINVSVEQSKVLDIIPNSLQSRIGVSTPEVNFAGIDSTETKAFKSSSARSVLRGLRDNKEIFSFRTPIQLFSDVVMISLDFTRNKDTGTSLSFRAVLEKPTFAQSQVIQEQAFSSLVERSSSSTVDTGTNTPAASTEADADSTATKRLFELITGTGTPASSTGASQ